MLAGPEALAQQQTESRQLAPAETAGLTEVTVTAQRRIETTQDIPYNISVIDPDQILRSGATTLDDLARIVNGLTTVDQGPVARGQTNNLTLRGLRTEDPGGGRDEPSIPGQTVNTVSTYFGETPIFFPMVLQDVERVEVLRGPQGTLYGSGAEAGTIRFIPRRPDFQAVDADVSATGSETANSGELNGDIHGMLNLPITDNLAARFVAGTEHLAGFINAANIWERESGSVTATPTPSIPGDLASGPKIGPVLRDVNSSDQSYGRADLRWRPTDIVDVDFEYLHQRTTQAAPQVSSPTYPGGTFDLTATNQITMTGGAYPHSSFVANAGGPYTMAGFMLQPYADTVDLGSVVATVDFGLATLTSATSYYDDDSLTVGDETAIYFGIGGANFNNFSPYNNYPRLLAVQDTPSTINSFIQELRLVSNGKNRFDYVVGAFYQNQKGYVDGHQYMPGIQDYEAYIGQPNPSTLDDQIWNYERHTDFDDKALFGELTGHVTEAWQITAGTRFFSQSFSNNTVFELPLCGAVCSTNLTDPTGLTLTNVSRTFSKNLKKLNTSYDFGPNTKLYATYSEGFRRGGTNSLQTVGPFASLPEYQVFDPDFAKNYEIGLKGMLLDRHLRYSAAIYRINLSNFQFDSRNIDGAPATYNGDRARSQGVELELQAAATDKLTLSFGYTYTDATVIDTVQKFDLEPYALITAFGGTGSSDIGQLFDIQAGSRLPGVPKDTANFAADYVIPAPFIGREAWTLLLHADGVYRSWAAGDIDVNSLYYWKVPSSFITNARMTLGDGRHMSYSLFVNNITSNTAYTGGANVQTVPNPFAYRDVARPRTVGLTLHYKY